MTGVVYLAESQEPYGLPGEPTGWSVVTVGVFSTREKAQAALEARVAPFHGVTALGDWYVGARGGASVTDDLACSWVRYLEWSAHPHHRGWWQRVETREIDARRMG